MTQAGSVHHDDPSPSRQRRVMASCGHCLQVLARSWEPSPFRSRQSRDARPPKEPWSVMGGEDVAWLPN